MQIQNKENTNVQFINTELKLDSDSELDSEAESKSDTELIAKLVSGPDSE